MIRESDDGSEAFVVVEPFPIDRPRQLAKRLALSDGITKFVRAYSRRQANGELKFDRIEYISEAQAASRVEIVQMGAWSL